ncbi:MAG TPA: hypothetical protein VJA21_04000 [Verrucomicrobiae bacterium]
MSLINDALKRAKAAQEDAPSPPPSSLQLRPVADTEIIARRGAGLLLPLALAIVALLILFFVWRYAPRGDAGTDSQASVSVSEVRARALPPQEVVQPTPPASVPSAVPAAAPETNAIISSVPSTPAEPPATAPAPAKSVAVAAAAPTNSVAAPESQPSPPVGPRLQGIVFDPARPSVVINGRTLFKGDKVAGFRVVAIGRDSVTLVSAGRTNVLTLEE